MLTNIGGNRTSTHMKEETLKAGPTGQFCSPALGRSKLGFSSKNSKQNPPITSYA